MTAVYCMCVHCEHTQAFVFVRVMNDIYLYRCPVCGHEIGWADWTKGG